MRVVKEYEPPGWPAYLVAAIIPPVAIIYGIVAMARGMVGPGLALWAVGFISFWLVWPTLILAIGAIASS